MDELLETNITFTWHIRMQRLCTATVRKHFNPELSNEEASKTTKDEALEYINKAYKYTEEWIKEKLKEKAITEKQANKAYKELIAISAEAIKLTEKL